MSTLKWMIVKNPNMREEKYLTSVSPMRFDIIERLAMKFTKQQVLAITETLLEMGISHELRQTK